ncbi:MAG: TRAP transporter small permease [Rhodobacteraceae bacterium]|nr:TRAP transporter small permease [Paracoccaceae bacterium]MCY4137329.1 TRAP transporter small permease [Paracoccaceae bacterium]
MNRPQSIGDRIEQTLIGGILGLMTAITFANVIARYVFNSNILWALELTVFLFAWTVLLGASYAVKVGSHLGVDIVLMSVSPRTRKLIGIFSVACCIVFSFLLLKGSWDYWANFANLPRTDGRWFPTGFEDRFRGKGWYETQDIPMPAVFRFLEDWFNDGDPYEKIPRLIPYSVLPLSMALLLWRFLQAASRLWQGEIDMLVASHEVDEGTNTNGPPEAPGNNR